MSGARGGRPCLSEYWLLAGVPLFHNVEFVGHCWGRKGNTRIKSKTRIKSSTRIKADDMRQLIQDDGKAVVYLAEEVIVYIGGGIITLLVIIIILVLIF